MAGTPDSKFVWMDGELKPYQDANVHVLSHSLHYGSAAFEGVRAYKTTAGRTAIFRAREHMERFERSARVFGGTLKFTTEQLVAAMAETIRANGFDECYIRPLAFIGNDSRGLKLPASPHMHVAIAVWKWGKYLGDAALQRGIKACVASFRRPDVSSSLPWAKLSGNYLNSIMARREATLNGCDEALLLDQQGYVAEGSGENVFVFVGGELLTPPPAAVLLGITRDCVLEMAKASGIKVRETPITRNQLYDADEVFLTGTAAEITPVSIIDGRQIGRGEPGPVSLRLLRSFEACTRGDDPKFASWLHYI